jgi:hypothetical protein
VIPQARVIAIGLSGLASTTSDVKGFYVLWNLPPGIYSLRAYANGYNVDASNGIRNICIHAGDEEYVDLTVLQPAHILWNDQALAKRRREELWQPSKAQTADVYSVGDC